MRDPYQTAQYSFYTNLWFSRTSSAGSAAYPAANRALFAPVYVHNPITVSKIVAHNGAAVSGNIDVGIYIPNEDDPITATRLVSSGTTAQTGTSVRQVFDITDTSLGRGTYYLAVAMDNTTGALLFATNGNAFTCAITGCMAAETSFVLPATVTLITTPSYHIPFLSMQTSAVPSP